MKRKATIAERPVDALRRGAEDRVAGRTGDAMPGRAYLWGWSHGAGTHPAFVAELLELPGGVALAERAASLLPRLPDGASVPPPDAEGMETLATLARSWEALAVVRALDPALRRSLDILVARPEFAAPLPRLLALLVAVQSRQTPLCPLRETVRRLAETFRDLPAPLAAPLLGVLEARKIALWGRVRLPRKPRHAHEWETKRWNESVAPLVECLRRTKDLRLTLRIEALGALADVPKGRASARRYAALLQMLPAKLRLAVAPPLASTLSHGSDPAGAARGLATLYRAFGSDDGAFGELVQITQSWQWCPEYGPAVLVLAPLLRGADRPTASAFCSLVTEVADTPVEVQVAPALARFYFVRFAAKPDSVDLGVRLAAHLAFDAPERAVRVFDAATRPELEEVNYESVDGAKVLRDYPGMRHTAALALLARPKQTLSLLAEFSQAENLPRPERDALGETRAVAPDRAAWGPVLQARRGAEEAMYELAALGLSAPPPGVLQAARLPEKLRREAAYLGGRPAVAVRRANLLARLEDAAGLAVSVAGEVSERLDDALAEARLTALRQALARLWANRLKALLRGPVASPNADLLHAARFSTSAGVNRRPLARLLREGDALEAHPSNVAFVRKLTESGFRWEAWRAERRVRVAFSGAEGDTLTLYAVQNPLRVLQMGTLFDTCLAADGCNSFSAVANAVDVNKRVVFAEDGRGKVVARQLLALTDDGKLLGFHVYNHLPPERQSAVRSLFRAWGAALAIDCGATLASEGEVSTLVSRAWYDDGATAWWPKTTETKN